ncbi:nitrilase [Metallumcola ferriviriculae]|uniref:Nitrilase n=1 Tax=Metallumcola ferriviriculae TaxID=3039180 RepID=A0AAU0UPI4_9FIRM|nr:nitrilase [Desulfitibacteraceae bacterium MK1]
MGWKQLQEQALIKYLLWRSRPKRLRRFLAGKEYFPIPSTVGDTVKVAAVQQKLSLISDPLAYAGEMYARVRQAVDMGAQLVVFPEDNTTQLLGMLPGLSAADNVTEAVGELDPQLKVADIFNYLSPVTRQVYYNVFSYLAARFNIHLLGGSIIVCDRRGRTVNQASLFGPDGKILGTQMKLHLLPVEVEWGLSCGEELSVFDTAVGKLAFPICMDATYFETFRIAVSKGAELVIIPAANPDEYNPWKELRGVWPRVQESGVYGIRASMVGEVLGMRLTGRSAIFAPLEITPNQDGILAQAESFDQQEMVISELDYKKLRQYRRQFGFESYLNKELCKKYLPHLYGTSPG